MPDHITTYTGIHFYPTEPNINDINIYDIAHALPLICRGNGHVKTFFSVGQHCVNCAREAELRGYGDRIALACLLHDASECYMSDVPRPFKKTMTEYIRQEEYLLGLVYEKFLGDPLTEEELAIMREIDDDMLYYDLTVLLNEPVPGPAPELKIKLNYDFQPFDKIEKQYLELFQKYSSGISAHQAL